MTKDEKRALAQKKMLFGVAVALFGMLWIYFDSAPMAFIVMGLLIFLYGLVLRMSL
jgi:apolipoprotein N-acyltransferase